MVYMILLSVFARVNPFTFLKKFVSVIVRILYGNLQRHHSAEHRDPGQEDGRRPPSLVHHSLGAINMDGTAIVQGVAVVFCPVFGVDLGRRCDGATATLASIGTAGVPSVGLITLSMVFLPWDCP
ncbi:MAG: cation:dicarboxylate symporter family transporter [Slackia sp.]